MARPALSAAALLVVFLSAGCKSPAPPSPVLASETFTGTLAPTAAAFHTFTVKYAFSATDLSVTVTSLAPLTGITIGIGFGTVSGASCSVVISQPLAQLNQELFANGGASAGTYCVQIYDAGTLTDTVNYSLTVKHY
jgi:hypothetical protein